MINALNKMADIFTSHNKATFEDVLCSSIQILAEAARVERVSVFRLISDSGRYGQIYAWAHGKSVPLDERLVVLPNIPVMTAWLDILSRGECYNGNVRDMTKDQADFCNSINTKSVFLAPVLTQGKFWGFVAMEDMSNCRYFADDCIELMRSAAQLCVNAFIRSEITREAVAANAFTHAILEAIPSGFTVFDEDLHVIDCNSSILKLLGTTKQYYIDNFHEFSSEFQNDGSRSIIMAKEFAKRAVQGNTQIFEWTHRSLSGELIPFEVTLTRTKYNGKFIILGYQYDISNLKKMMENIQEKSELLKDALEKVSIASKAKSEFLSNMSHEMRTPLSAIIGMTTIGMKTSDSERKDYTLKRIEEASTHLLGVINSILDMSKIEAKKFDLCESSFSFRNMLNAVVNVVNIRVKEKQQKLKVRISGDIPDLLFGDEQRLAQVFTNIVGNAVKFTPEEGEIAIDVTYLGENDGLCTMQVSVSDTGVGISPTQQETLFQPFHQAENSTSRKYGGTGLGLTISKSIVEMMGGKIWIESELGKGARFTFTIRAKRGQAKNTVIDSPCTENQAPEGIGLSPPVFAGRRLLLAEDNEINREIVLSLLEPTQLEIHSAANGAIAVQMFQKAPHKYDMIFMDIQMPEMDGLTATRCIRALENPKAKAIPIIALTANVFKEDVEKCLEAGMDCHLGKPLNYEEVISKLQIFLPEAA